MKAPSPIFGHQDSSGHKTSMEDFQIIGREENSMARTIKEAMYIRVNNPTLNRNFGNTNSHTYGIEFYVPSQNSKSRKNNYSTITTVQGSIISKNLKTLSQH